MEETQIVLERCTQRLNKLEQDVRELRTVQTEIRSMNETLVTLATELKHTNEHLARHEQKIEEIDARPGIQLRQIVTAVVSAIAGGVLSYIIGTLFG